MTVMTIPELEKLLLNQEGENLEFKAKSSFTNDELFDYCAALSNEGGGYLIFGVDNNRAVVGTNLFLGTHQQLPNSILNGIGIKVKIEELQHPNGRVLVFCIPPRSKGRPVQSKGKYTYPMRAGESLTEMDQESLKVIFIEIDDDFSAKSVPNLLIADLDLDALSKLRTLIIARNRSYLNMSDEEILRALELSNSDGRLNIAALILLGKKVKIGELLPGAEIIFEWRQEPDKIPHGYRKDWREPFIKIFDDVWKTISDRNSRIPLQEGLIQKEILAFNELAVREALLNAVTHRDYSVATQSVFIKADPTNFLIISPGGFLPGITAQNVLKKQAWRNRRIAEIFQKLGLVERSGQGMDQIFESTIRDGKGLPDLSGSDPSQVSLRIPARVQDKGFILFLEKITKEKDIRFSFDEIFQLELLREKKVLDDLNYKEKFLEFGVIEKIGKTSGIKYILSHRYYEHEDRIGLYTRLKGLTREAKKKLILEHIKREGSGKMIDFIDAFSDLKRSDIHNLIQELKQDGLIFPEGKTRAAVWKLTNLD